MRWPQIVMLVSLGGNIGMNLALDGKAKDGKYNFIGSVISCIIEAAILRAGGFW